MTVVKAKPKVKAKAKAKAKAKPKTGVKGVQITKKRPKPKRHHAVAGAHLTYTP